MAVRGIGPALVQLAAGLLLGTLALRLMGAAQPAAPAEPPPAPPVEPAPPAGQGAQPVVSYDLTVRLDPVRHQLTGKGTVRWRNQSARPQSEIYLHLYLNAFKSPQSAFLRSPAGRGFRGGGMPGTYGWLQVERLDLVEEGRARRELWPQATPAKPDDADRTDYRVPLGEEVAPGEAIALELGWRAQLPEVVLRTGFAGSFHMVAQWFPKLARLEPDGSWAHFPFERLSEFYADYGSYRVRVEVPQGFEVGATGRLTSATEAGGWRVLDYAADRVHDFAFAAWDRFEVEERQAGGVALRALHPPGYREIARLELDVVERALGQLSARYGRYPYDTLTIVHPPEEAAEAGGMEYPTLITTGGRWFWPHLGVRFIELVTLHELAHQWFYGLVGSNEHRWPFLDEGLTEWTANDLAGDWYGSGSAADILGLEVGMPAVERFGALRVQSRGPIAQAAGAFASGSDYGALVYSRTATVLETAARVWGRDRVRGALGRYAERHRFGHPGPEDLLWALREVLGDEAAAQLEAALLAPGWVDYEIDAVQPDYARVRRHGDLRFPVEVALIDDAGAVERVRWEAREPHAILERRGARPLAAAVVDPDATVLLDENLANNARRVGGDRAGSWRVLGHAALAAQLALWAVAP